MALGVERDDLQLDGLALVDDVTRMGHALVRQLADVDQALESLPHPNERAEVDDLGHGAVDDVADLEVRHREVVRVGAAGRGIRTGLEVRPRSWLMSMTSASTSSPTW